MKIKGDAKPIEDRLETICECIEGVVEDYERHYAEYGWDSFSETLANVSAQLYMMRMMIHNAEVMSAR